jgi:hypothetical protein
MLQVVFTNCPPSEKLQVIFTSSRFEKFHLKYVVQIICNYGMK